MNVCKNHRAGFTLVEILIAAALIAILLSAVYGSYAVISKSTLLCRNKLTKVKNAQMLLNTLARQIRCCYCNSNKQTRSNRASQIAKADQHFLESPSCFEVNQHDSGKRLLSLTTTNGSFRQHSSATGLWELTYRFDAGTGALYVSKRTAFPVSVQTAGENQWLLVAESLEHLKLSCFDGREWQDQWDFDKIMAVPIAVGINVGFRNENGELRSYQTITRIKSSYNNKQNRQ